MARKVYPPEIKARAVAFYFEHGAAEAERRTGVPAGTIRSWASRNDVATDREDRTRNHVAMVSLRWEQRRLEMADRIGEVAEKALLATELALERGETRKASDASAVVARLVDKAQLLTGAATARTEHTGAEAVHTVIDELTERRDTA